LRRLPGGDIRHERREAPRRVIRFCIRRVGSNAALGQAFADAARKRGGEFIERFRRQLLATDFDEERLDIVHIVSVIPAKAGIQCLFCFAAN